MRQRRYTFCRPDDLTVSFGKLVFGAEPPRRKGEPQGLRFLPCGVVFEDDGFTVFGRKRSKRGQPQVWRADTKDGLTFTGARKLYEVPATDKNVHWAAGWVARKGRELLLLQCHIGDPPRKGHPFYAFGGSLDGGGWRLLSDKPVYRGQDSLKVVWNDERKQFVNYHISYQPWPKKRFPDNMGSVRRVLHIRTSPDGVQWTPGGSFGVDGPHLPVTQLIVPGDTLESCG
jgi:hypothetical protein